MTINPHFTYALLWLSFALPHSILASHWAKAALGPTFRVRYRLCYNVFATLHIALILWIGRGLYRDSPGMDLPLWLNAGLIVMGLAGLCVLLMALLQYDLGLFSGLKQLRTKPDAAPATDVLGEPLEPLQLQGLHRHVRHPLYSGLFLLLWANAGTPFGLVTALFGSLYLIIGTHYEEKKLIQNYGEEYTRYRQTVPAFIPRFNNSRFNKL